LGFRHSCYLQYLLMIQLRSCKHNVLVVVCVGCVMYASNLILMTSSLTMLQKMIDVCLYVYAVTNELDMTFDAKVCCNSSWQRL